MYCFIIQSKLMIGNSWRKYSNSSIRKNLISKSILLIIIGAFLFDGIVLSSILFLQYVTREGLGENVKWVDVNRASSLEGYLD